MLEELHIKNLALIEDTNIDFSSPYISLVGETGAGKTLIVDSLSILKGDKFDFSLIRDKSKKTVLSASFVIDDSLIDRNEEFSEYLTKQLLVKRIINTDHSSRYYINDEQVSSSVYKKILSLLIDIHSQGENSSLLDEKNHLYYLDSYLKNDLSEIKKEYSSLYSDYLKDLQQLKTMEEEKEDFDKDYLLFQINEIEKYHLKENEIEDLINEESRMKSYQNLLKDYQEFSSILYQSDIMSSLSSLLSVIRRFKDSQIDVSSLADNLSSLKESISQFENDFENMDIDPDRLEYINQRLFDLKGLMKKYGRSTEEILGKLDEYKRKLSFLDEYQIDKDNLLKKIDKKKEQLFLIAKKLSSTRKENAYKLEKDISSVLKKLLLKEDGFKIQIKDKELSKDGVDDVSFLISLNEGMPFSSLKEAVSGGENSRLMLALKSIMNSLDPSVLLVFDEVDTGVSGKVAFYVGTLLKEISKTSQVLVISHLPQVVASSYVSYEVEKKTLNNTTISTVKELNEKERIKAIAKLLSSKSITDEALLQAENLVKEFK
ncbi:MAG: DNA repair protein RecN [Candidatus Enterosoma sp.]|nr:DNA repair protein RecN [Bacilli bacterium]MDY3907925.1 DNA repair protein RecN [Candidatus Enterosoma sp.]